MDQFAACDAHLLVVSFANLARLTHWVPYFRRRFLDPVYSERGVASPADPFARTRFLADPTRAAYHAYGLGRNTMLRVYGPHILWQYVKWAMQGKPIRLRDDTLQRGGDFVVGGNGQLTLSHTGRDQSDRPPTGDILAALREG